MTERLNDPTPRPDSSSPTPESISRADQPALPRLSESVYFSYSPQSDADNAAFTLQDELARNAPQLPDPQKIEKFYTDSRPLLEFPPEQSTQTETLSLDAMLALVRPKKAEHAARILTVALTHWRTIDGRAFGAPPYQNTPFKSLEAQAQTAKDLLSQTKLILKTLKSNFSTPPQQILQTFTGSVAHYRGEPAWRSLQEASLLAAYEMVYDSGATPHIPRPEMQRSDDSRAKELTKPQGVQTQDPKQRKVLNYGRPDSTPTQSNATRASEPSTAEIRRRELETANIEGEHFLHQQHLKEYESFKNEIRKPGTPHERYGRPIARADTSSGSDELRNIPDWIKQSIQVAGSNPAKDSRPTPPIQDVAQEVAAWAVQFISYTEQHTDLGGKATWNLAWLQNQLAPVIKYHTHCKHIIRVVEDLSQQIRELGGYDSLRNEDKGIVDRLAPLGSASGSVEIKNSWGGEPISSDLTGAANAARMQAEEIRLLAIAYLRDKPDKLRYIEDSETAWRVAQEMATEALKKPKRPLGE